MTPIRIRAALALACAAFTAACGGGDGATGPTFSDSVSAVEAAEFSDDAIGIASQIAFGINGTGPTIGFAAPAMVRRAFARGSLAALPSAVRARAAGIPVMDWRTPGALAGLMSTASEGCTVTAHGTREGLDGYVDVNANDIPDDLYVKTDCTTTDSTSDTLVIVHVILLQQVKEDFSALYGFDYTVGYDLTVQDQFGNTYTGVSFDASERVDIRAAVVTHRVRTFIRGWNEVGGVRGEGTDGQNFTAAFDPAGTITLGAPVGDGTLTLSGRDFFTQSDGRNLSFDIGTTAPLTYSAACFAGGTNPPFTTGVIVGHLNDDAAQASFIVAFTGCDAYDISYQGTVG